MMPPGTPPIGLFRTFARNMPMAEAMGGWGSYELSRRLSLSMRHRGYDVHGIARSVSELPGRAALDAAEVVTLAGGSLRHRTLLL